MTTAAFPPTCQCGHSQRVHWLSQTSREVPCTICHCRNFRLHVDDLTHTPPRQTILERAAEIVDNREQQYGHPKDNLPRIARLWSEILGITVTAEQVCLCMILLKIARAVTSTEISEDTIVDMIGYSYCIEKLRVEETGS